jgi:hypothetical protein
MRVKVRLLQHFADYFIDKVIRLRLLSHKTWPYRLPLPSMVAKLVVLKPRKRSLVG